MRAPIVQSVRISFAIFLVALGLPTIAASQTVLVTVEPYNFAPGQDVSNATSGAQLQALTAVINPDPNAPVGQLYLPKNFPVYVQAFTSDCNYFGATCSADGNRAFSYTQSTQPATSAVLWGETYPAAFCLQNLCDLTWGGILSFVPVLRVNLAAPTNYVSALIAFAESDGSSIVALDGAGNIVGACDGFPNGARGITNNPCASVYKFTGFGDFAGWGRYTISSPSANISTVLIGGLGSYRSVAQIQFNSSVSFQLSALLTAVTGVGPGKALANDVRLAQSYYAASDVQSTCSYLAAFADLVRAQTGKKIDAATASQLLSTASSLTGAIGCQ
jgi:hypothetical protein